MYDWQVTIYRIDGITIRANILNINYFPWFNYLAIRLYSAFF